MDHYQTLGVTGSASLSEIKAAFRAAAKKSHPDLCPGDAIASTRFREITEAYQILCDPELRSRYDQLRAAVHQRENEERKHRDDRMQASQKAQSPEQPRPAANQATRGQRFVGGLVWLSVAAGMSWGIVSCNRMQADTLRDQMAQEQRDLTDPLVAPVLSSEMAAPGWTIGKWMASNQKSADCSKADEYMDQNIAEQTVTRRRGQSQTYRLADYVRNCDNRLTQTLRMVEPYVNKWCDYRKTRDRLYDLCEEWEDHKDEYIKSIMDLDQPTVRRYNNLLGIKSSSE